MKKSLQHIIIAALTTVFVASIATSSAQDYPQYLFDNGHSSFNQSATAITTTNASTLVEDWSFIDPQPMPGQPNAGFYSSPVVFKGVVYIGSNTGNFYALDETTGAVLWQQLLGFTTPLSCGSGHGVISTATLGTDPVSGTLTVYVGGGDGYLYALDAATGNIVFRVFVTQVGTTHQNTGFIWGSPTIITGRIYLGWASACDNPLVLSGMKSFDQHTGTLLRTFFTLPHGSTGAGVWSTAATDGNSLWITTGNGDPGGYSYGIVKLKATNLTVQTFWDNPLTGDLDWGSSPTLFQARLNNRNTTMVGASGKDGIFHALDANNLQNGPVWSFQIGASEDFRTGTCLAAPIWDSIHRILYVAGNLTTINGTSFGGSVRAFNPANGSVIWERGVNGGPIMGTPTLNGSGVIAAGTYNISNVTRNSVYLFDASSGSILFTLPEPTTLVWAQPVFAGNHLFIANAGGVPSSFGKLTAYIPSALKASKK